MVKGIFLLILFIMHSLTYLTRCLHNFFMEEIIFITTTIKMEKQEPKMNIGG